MRVWTVVAAVSATVLLVGCSSTEAGTGSGSGGVSGASAAPSSVVGGFGGLSAQPDSGAPSSAPPSSPSSSASHPPSASSSAGSPSAHGSSSASAPSGGDWTQGVDWASLPHPDLDCSHASGHGAIENLKVVKADVTGDGSIDAIVREQCQHDASEWPDSVYVYSHAGAAVTLAGTLLRQSDDSYATKIVPGNRSVTLTTQTWSSSAAGCCPDLTYRTVFSWTGSGFSAGPRTDVLHPCTGAASDSLPVTTHDLGGAAGHAGIVLVFTNDSPQACTLTGYPGVDADFSGGGTVHATRTLSGYMGGPGHVSTVTLAAGGTASARIEWTTVPTGSEDCSSSSTDIQVTAPNTSDTQTVDQAVGACSLQVHPVVAGSDG
ncbi:MAG: DUF4232 domain-containing protein [Jatrophihabitans sp.]|uniref:DUF4232 domain-containing protein n=1 Tax=Jatrophihabitans sp. TaxID=1932789 RepID=UPI003F822E8C